MKQGRREISPETAALLADIAHEDPRQAVIDAVIERNKTGPKAEQLREILGKALVAGALATLAIDYSGHSIGATEIAAAELTRLHIVLSSLASLIAAFLVIGCATVRVPQDRSKVKSKGLRPSMLARSLRFASSCGLRFHS